MQLEHCRQTEPVDGGGFHHMGRGLSGTHGHFGFRNIERPTDHRKQPRHSPSLCWRSTGANVGSMNPTVSLALLAIAGLLATRLPRPPMPRSPTLQLLIASGMPLLLLGVLLGPGVGLLDRPTLAALAPVTALVVGWVGARLGARWEWRMLQRVPPETWGVVAAQAVAGVGVGFLAAWLGTKLVPALAAAWTPRVPAALTLGAVAIVPGAGAMERAARAAGLAPRLARSLRRVALLNAASGALVCAAALGWRYPRVAGVLPGWIAGLALEAGAGALVGTLFLGLSRFARERADLGFALLAVLLFGAGLAYAADLSPFVVCGLAVAFIVNRSPHRHRVRALLATWARPTYELLFVLVGAALTLPTLWVLAAAPVLAALRVLAQWSTVRSGLGYLPAATLPPIAGLASVAQGASALALGLGFSLARGAGGALLTTIAFGVVLTQAVAPALMRLAVAPARLTAGVPATELSSDPDRE